MIRVRTRLSGPDGYTTTLLALDAVRQLARTDGFEVGPDIASPDAVLMDMWTAQRSPSPLDDDPPAPVFVFQVEDSAAVNIARQLVSHPRVVSFIKNDVYVPASLQNAPHLDGAYHGTLIGTPGRGTQPMPTIPDPDLAKIDLFLGLGGVGEVRPYAAEAPDLDAARPFDLHFVVNLSYRGSAYETHRRDALEAVRGMIGSERFTLCLGTSDTDRPGWSMGPAEFMGTMRSSKAVLSPWGWGETSARDFQAALCGAVLIKPLTDFATTWPPLEPGVHYLPCRPDFADLPELALRVARDWPAWRPWRAAARAQVLRVWEEGARGGRLAAIIRKRLGRDTAAPG